MEFIRLIDILGIAAFSISGVFAAMEKKLDVFGVFVIAFITALGGGTLRDILIGDVPVKWMHDLTYGLTVFISITVVIVFTKTIRNYHTILLFFDSLGLGLFTILGIQKGIALNLHPVACITLGTITAVFGGIIRDIVLNNLPLIFQKEIYATACVAGGVLFFLLPKLDMPDSFLQLTCISFIVFIRLIAVKNKWQLPILDKAKD